MDFLSPLYNNIPISTLACTFLLLFFLRKLLLAEHKHDGLNEKLVPEVSGGRPIIGHLHLLMAGGKPPHLIFTSMADKYGPISRMRLGTQHVLVVSNVEIAKECLTVKDKKLATWPKALASEIMGYNYSMLGITPYGTKWREMRKIVVLEMLSNGRIELLRPMRESHVRRSIKRTFDDWSNNKDTVRDGTRKMVGLMEDPPLFWGRDDGDEAVVRKPDYEPIGIDAVWRESKRFRKRANFRSLLGGYLSCLESR